MLEKDVQTTTQIIKKLKGEKYVVPTSGSKKKGFALTGKPKFSAVSTEPNFSKMIAQYFNPEAKVAHHVRYIYIDQNPSVADRKKFVFPDSVVITQDKIGKTAAMQVMPCTAEASNIEIYLQDVENPNTPEWYMSPNRSVRRESTNQYSPRNLIADVARVCNRNSGIANMKDKLAPFRHQSLGKHGHDDKIGGLRTPEPTRKRLRSSKTVEHINVGDEQSPSEKS